MITRNQRLQQPAKSSSCPEHELFLYASRRDINPETAAQIRRLLQEGINWDNLIQSTISFGAPPLLYWNLITYFSEDIPSHAISCMQNIFFANTAKNTILAEKLSKILDYLQEHEILAIPFKGPVLALSAYGNLGMRIFSDLDILVRKEDFERAKQLLSQIGYKAQYENLDQQHQLQAELEHLQTQLVNTDDRLNLDLHYGIPPRCLQLTSILWWDHLESFLLSGKKIQILMPEAHLIILCINGSKEAWNLFGKVCDIAALISTYKELNWAWIEKQAAQHKIKNVVYFALFIAHVFMGSHIPEHIHRSCDSNLIMRGLVMGLSKRIFPQGQSFHRLRFSYYDIGYLLFINQWKLPQIATLILLPKQADKRAFNLPKQLFFLYYLVRPIRLMVQYGLLRVLNPAVR